MTTPGGVRRGLSDIHSHDAFHSPSSYIQHTICPFPPIQSHLSIRRHTKGVPHISTSSGPQSPWRAPCMRSQVRYVIREVLSYSNMKSGLLDPRPSSVRHLRTILVQECCRCTQDPAQRALRGVPAYSPPLHCHSGSDGAFRRRHTALYGQDSQHSDGQQLSRRQRW